MAKAHCKKHKRFVPTCDPCKSAALKETVGFPGVSAEGPSTNEPVDVGDIPEYEPDEEEPVDEQGLGEGEPVPVGGMFPPKDIDKTEEAMAADGEFDPASHPVTPEEDEAVAVEIDGDGNVVPVTPGEGEPEPCSLHPDGCPEGDQPALPAGFAARPIDVAMLLFPRRLIPDGETEVEGRGLVAYEQLVSEAVEGYLKLDLSPEDANIVVAAEIIRNDQLNFLPVEDADEEVEEAFEAGVEAAPEITGCIEDYNQGFNDGMSALHRLMIEYYAGDEDAVAYEMMRWLERQMKEMKK